MLFVGALTLLAAGAATLEAFWLVIGNQSPQHMSVLCVSLLCVAVAMLGAGAYSVDAQLLKRKRIVFGESR